MRALRVTVVAGILVLALGTAASGAPASEESPAEAAYRALGELRLEDAARATALLASHGSGSAAVLDLEGRLAFHRGDYATAANKLEASLRAEPARARDPRPELLALARDTREATASFVEVRSPDGRFVVRHPPGRDAVLVRYALAALAAADAALARELGTRVPGPVLLELYPTAAALAQVSTLSVADIERTGTIALCKWDRLMVTSPRALVRGYPWMDTIAHELAHRVITRATRDRAPVWLQEGLAKFLEELWREPAPQATLDPASAGLLLEATRRGGLIPFDRLHPSIALLPSQSDAALAFAQVSTFVESFHRRRGAEGLRRALALVAEGRDAREALAEVAGASWSSLEAEWRADLAERPGPAGPTPRVLGLRFHEGATDADDAEDVAEGEARRRLRLGDLLWGHGRPAAAAVEYERGLDSAPSDPILASRLARAALAAGDAGRASVAAERALRLYPDHAPAHAHAAMARLLAGDAAGADRAARAAIRLNPFDPRPHCVLSEVAPTAEERQVEDRVCQELGGPSP